MDRDARAVILAVDDDAEALAHLELALRGRYSADYEVLCASGRAEACDRLRELYVADRAVAVVLSDQWMQEATGIQLLAEARSWYPLAKRALLVSRGDWSVCHDIIGAMALGQIDGYVPKPGRSPDEQFHRVVTEFLDGWARGQDPPFVAVRIVGEQWDARCAELRDLLDRSHVPFELCTVDSPGGRQAVERVGAEGAPLPLVELYTGEVLVDPPNERIAQAFAVTEAPEGVVDVAVVGAGPAGLAAAVYAASEGLSTVVLDREAIGGQAGTSSLIRNYLGFPRGISGADLTFRAFEQAWMFGAHPYLMRAATGLRVEPDLFAVELDGAPDLLARSVVVATGVSYRRLGVPSLEAFLGAGVYDGAAVTEAKALAGQHLFVAGGGNSAGQAAVHLAKYAGQVSVLVRSGSLSASMSAYLIREVEAAHNIDVRFNAAPVGGEGTGRLERLSIEDRLTGTVGVEAAGGLFVLIGGDPRTSWLPPSVRRDPWGFVITGADLVHDGPLGDGWPLERAPMLLETSVPGVFAVGDVRHASVKRVASAVGEGSAAVRLVHLYLDERRAGEPAR